MLSKFFFITNIILLGVVFSLKSYYETSIEWLYELPWFTFFNVFIDLAIKNSVGSESILTFWFVSTLTWTGYSVYQMKFKTRKHREFLSLDREKPLDIDEISEKYSFSSAEADKHQIEKVESIPETAGVNFAAALNKAVSAKTDKNPEVTSDGFFDQANQALSSMSPEAAEQLKRVQTVLNDFENKESDTRAKPKNQ